MKGTVEDDFSFGCEFPTDVEPQTFPFLMMCAVSSRPDFFQPIFMFRIEQYMLPHLPCLGAIAKCKILVQIQVTCRGVEESQLKINKIYPRSNQRILPCLSTVGISALPLFNRRKYTPCIINYSYLGQPLEHRAHQTPRYCCWKNCTGAALQ